MVSNTRSISPFTTRKPSTLRGYCQSEARRRLSRACAAIVAGSAGLISLTAHADTADNVNLNASPDLGSGANFSTTNVPNNTNDMTFLSGTYSNTSFNLASGSITPGTLDDLDTTQAISITDSMNSITLSTLANASPGSVPSDLLYVANGGNLTIAAPVVLGASANGNFDIAGSGVAAISGIISDSGTGFTKTGTGTLTFNGSAANTYTGNTTVNSGTLNLDYTNYTGSNLIAGGNLSLGGGTLNMLGNSNGMSSQTFAGTTIASGANVISAGMNNNNPTLNLGALSFAASTVQFVGPATINSSGNVAATATITTTTAGRTTSGLIVSGAGTAYATVGLYDWASTNLAGSGGAGSSPYTIIGGSQVAGFYTALAGTLGANSNNVNFDVTSATAASNGSTTFSGDTLRFNTNTATAFTVSLAKNWGVAGILVTPNVGVHNVTITNSTSGANGLGHNNSNPLTIFQNNTSGELIFNSTNWYGYTGSGSYIQSGPGTVFLNGTAGNNYTGQTYLNGGVTEIGPNTNGGTGGNGGQLGATLNSNVNINGGTLVANFTATLDNGVNSPTTDHPIVLGSNSGGVGATTGNTLTVDGVVSGAAGTGPLVIGIPASANNGSVVGQLPGTGTGTANTQVLASGTVVLTNTANSYAGGTVIDSGTLQFTGSGLAVSTAVFGTGGITLNGGTFQWASGNTTDVSATQTLTFASTGTLDTQANNVTLASPIGNGGPGGFTKAGAGTLTLNGANTFRGGVTLSAGALTLGGANIYTGNTNVNAGTLTLASAGSLGNTAVTVATGATFLAQTGNLGIGSGGASLSLASGSTFSMQDASIGTLNLNGNSTPLTIGGATGSAANLDFDLNSTSADTLHVSGGAVSLGTAGGKIFIAPLGSAAPASGTQYVLISDSSGGLGTSGFQLGSSALIIGGTSYSATLANSTSTQEILTLNAASLNYYWTGGTSASWSAIANFATDQGGQSAQSGSLSSSSNVFETANAGPGSSSTKNFTQTLDGSQTVNSLSFTGTGTPGAVSSVTLAQGSGGNLTLGAGNAFVDANANHYAAGVGLVVQAGAVSNAISANIVLGSSQAWEIDNNPIAPLTVSGNISDNSAGYSLTKTGQGELILSGTNSYGGGTAVSAGTLQLGSASALPTTGTLTVNGSTFDLNGNSETISALSDGGVSTGTVTTSTGTPTLTINNAAPSTYSGNISGGLSISYTGSSTLTLSGANSYTGLTTVSNGTLVAASDSALGSAAAASLLMTGTSAVDFTSSAPTLASLNRSSATSSIVLGNSGGSATTLTVNSSSGSPSVFAGVISDLNSTTAFGNLSLIGTGTLTLSGPNTFHGSTTIASGATTVVANTNALQNSAVDLSNGTLNFAAGITTATFGSLQDSSGSQALTLQTQDASPLAVALTMGGNNATTAFAGNINGSGGLIKVGIGAFTIANANYTGNTTVSSGTLNINGGTMGSGGSTIIVGTAGGLGPVLNITGGSVSAATITVGDGAASSLNVSGNASLTATTLNVATIGGSTGSAASITGNASGNFGVVNLASSSNTAGNITINTTGIVNLGVASFNKNSTGTAPSPGAGLIINAGTVTATSIVVDPAAHEADVNINGGSLTIGSSSSTGAFELGTTGNFSYLTMTGGTLSYAGTDGLVAGTSSANTYITINGATSVANLTGITLDQASTPTISTLTVGTGATLYLGSVGLAAGSGGTTTATFGAATIGATANWSSSSNVPITLSTGSTTFQAADASSVAQNITLNGSVSGSGGLTKTGAGYLALAGGSSYSGPTNVSAGTLVDVQNQVLGSSSSLNINGSMIIQNSPSLQNVTQEVAGGFNGGTWNGSSSSAGIPITSSAAANDSTHRFALGVIQNDNGMGTNTPLYTSFEGYSSLNDSDVLIKYTYYGDALLTGSLTAADYGQIDNAFNMDQAYYAANPGGTSPPLTGWFNGDFNYDGLINGDDYTLIDNAYNTQNGIIAGVSAGPANLIAGDTEQIAGATTSTVVPEPASVSLITFGAIGLLKRRRRRRGTTDW